MGRSQSLNEALKGAGLVSGASLIVGVAAGFVAGFVFGVSAEPAFAANSTSSSSGNHARNSHSANLQKKRAAASLLSAPMQAKEDYVRTQHSPPVAPTIENNHTRARRFLKEGARLHRIGEYADAERLFRESVALDPRNADAFYNLGALAEGRGDFVDALGQYRAALHIQPNDKSLKDAVESMEVRLAAGQGVHASPSDSDRNTFKYPSRMFSNPNPVATFSNPSPVATISNPDTLPPFSDLPVLGVSTPDAPAIATYNDPAPILPANNNGPFQLQSSQNTLAPTLVSTGSASPNFGMLNVRPPSLPSVMPVSQPSRNRRVAGATLNAAMRFGMRAALSGTGLHCPACHWLRF